MEKSKYQIEAEKLKEIENELIRLILETNSEELWNKFLEWQTQRNCFNATIAEGLKQIEDEGRALL